MLATPRPPAHVQVSAGRNKFVDPDSPLLPPVVPVWADALKDVDQSPQRIMKDAPKKVYALPEPALFVTPSNDQKKLNYLMTWIKSRPAWIWRLESQENAAVSAQTWRDFLGMSFNQEANTRTEAGRRRERMQKLLGNALNKPGLSYSSGSGDQVARWHGQQLADNAMPPSRVVHEVLWELYELGFRYELLALDRRLSHDHDQQSLSACFPGSSSGLTSVAPSAASNGLVSHDWRTRLRYVGALVRVMRNWNVSQYPSIFGIVESRPELITEQQALELERAAAGFYTQLFFDHFGRAPIVPHRLD